MNIRKLVNVIGFDLDEQDLARVETRVRASAEKIGQIGQKMALGISLPMALIGGAAVRAAARAEESASKFATVFDTIPEKAEQTAERLRQAYGLARDESKELLSDTGDLLVGFGFTEESALDLSEKVQQLAVDLASFTNYQGGASGASRALTKALLGEREMVKSLGIAILEEDVKTQMATESAQGLTFATEREAKAHATYTLAVKQSQKALGDYARTKESLTNKWRLFLTRVRDGKVAMGNFLIEVLKLDVVLDKLTGLVEKATDAIRNMSDEQKRFVFWIGAVVFSIGPVLIGYSLLVKAGFGVIGMYRVLMGVMVKSQRVAMLTSLKVAAIPLAIAAAVGAAVVAIEDLMTYFAGGDSIVGKFLEPWETLGPKIRKALGPLPYLISGIWDSVKGIISGFGEFFSNFIKDDIEGAADGLEKIILSTLDFVGNFVASVVFALVGVAPKVLEALYYAFRDIVNELFDRLWDLGFELGGRMIDGIVAGLKSIGSKVVDFAGDVAGGAWDFLTGKVPGGKSPAYAGIGNQVVTNNRSQNQNINVQSRVNLEVPKGTPEEQVSAVENAAKRGARTEWERILSETRNSYFDVE